MPPEKWEVDCKVRSYKVGFSRCLTCYSAVAYLFAVTRIAPQPHVSREDVRNMVALSPLDRLLWVGERAAGIEGVRGLVDKMVFGYLDFLEIADRGKAQLLRDFGKARFASERAREKRAFGDAMFELVSRLGEHNPLMRWLVV